MAAAPKERSTESRVIGAHPSPWKPRKPHATGAAFARRSLVTAAAVVALAAASSAASADAPEQFAWRLSPSTRYSADVHLTHVISNDLSGIYKTLAGSKADPVTILEDRTIAVTAGAASAINVAVSDARRYGGVHPKDPSVVTRTSAYAGTLAGDGKRTPNDEPLVDAGDGALAQLPDTPISPGQSWTFSRTFLIDRDLGQGSMTYTDTFERVDVRDGHRIAVIAVKASGRADVVADLKAKGFQTADMTLAGTAEFDLTSGLAGTQHYTAHTEWGTHVLWVHLGLIFDDTYDAVAWTAATK
jgi:hypothetical protein